MSEIAQTAAGAPPAAAQVAPAAPAARTPARRHARSFCMNCDSALMGEFCSVCGQRATEYSVSLRVLAKDFADEYLSFDSRLFRSVLNLFFRPGFLTRQYLIGRRASYVAPLRLYIVASLLFFLAFPFVSSGFSERVPSSLDLESATAERTGAAAPSEPGAQPEVARAEPTVEGLPRNVQVLGLNIDTQERVHRLTELGPRGVVQAFADGFERYLPRMMFLLLPLFAMLLKVLYARRNWYYAEHFIFALHIHAFFFALFLLLIVVPDGTWGINLLPIWGMVYLFLAMRHVYRQGWIKTAVKYMVLTGAYSLALTMSFVGLLLATLIFA